MQGSGRSSEDREPGGLLLIPFDNRDPHTKRTRAPTLYSSLTQDSYVEGKFFTLSILTFVLLSPHSTVDVGEAMLLLYTNPSRGAFVALISWRCSWGTFEIRLGEWRTSYYFVLSYTVSPFPYVNIGEEEKSAYLPIFG